MSGLHPQIEVRLLKHAWRWNDLWKLVKPTLTKRLTSRDASCVRGDQNIHMWQRGAASVASSGLQMFRTWKWVSVQPRFDKQVSAWIRSINPTPSAEPAQTAVDETSSRAVCLYPRSGRSRVSAVISVGPTEERDAFHQPRPKARIISPRSWSCDVSPDRHFSALISPPLRLFFTILPPPFADVTRTASCR